jgi:peptidyl-prolyl cis-trans isomerase C
LYALNRAQRPPDELSTEERAAIFEEVIQIYLLAGAAEDQAIDEERTMAAQIELQRLNALARTAVARYRETNEVTETELREVYEASLDELGAPQFKARHILLKTEPEAVTVIEELKGGADFAELAKEQSTGPTGPNGGDLGWFDASTMVAPFADAVRTMTAGSFSESPVETRFGWHVILLEDSRENQPPGLDAVRDQMQSRVEQSKIEAYIASLREKAVLDVEGSQL